MIVFPLKNFSNLTQILYKNSAFLSMYIVNFLKQVLTNL